MAEQLERIIIAVTPEGTLSVCVAEWSITGKLAGHDAGTTVSGRVEPKPITDNVDLVIAAVLAQGPPAPPETP